MTEDATDNKVETKDPDLPILKHEVEEIIEREQAEKESEGVTPKAEPEPEVPDWQLKHSEMEKELAGMKEKYNNLDGRYTSSSEEGKRLAGEVEKYKSQDEYLRSNYNLDPLLEGYEAPVAPEEQPITRAELQQWQIENEWRGAEETFFHHPDNKDMGENPMLREMVKRWVFDDSGGLLRHPEATALESYALAAKEVRNFLAGERLRGKEESMTTRTELERANIVEDGGAQPEVTDNKDAEDTVSGEDSYVDVWKKNRERTQGDF